MLWSTLVLPATGKQTDPPARPKPATPWSTGGAETCADHAEEPRKHRPRPPERMTEANSTRTPETLARPPDSDRRGPQRSEAQPSATGHPATEHPGTGAQRPAPPMPTKPINNTTANANTAAPTSTSASEFRSDPQGTAARGRAVATRRRPSFGSHAGAAATSSRADRMRARRSSCCASRDRARRRRGEPVARPVERSRAEPGAPPLRPGAATGSLSWDFTVVVSDTAVITPPQN